MLRCPRYAWIARVSWPSFASWTVLSTSYFQRDGRPRNPAIDLAWSQLGIESKGWSPWVTRSCDGDFAQEDNAFDVVDEIGHSDLDRCSGDPDSPDEQAHPILLLGEHMLDTRTDFRFRIVGPPHRLRHSAAFRLLAMDMADEAVLGQERIVGRRSVSGICQQTASRFFLVEQSLEKTKGIILHRNCGRN